jgi:hypothetical protein
MLVFLGKDMVNYVYQLAYRYLDSIFFEHLPLQCLGEGLPEFNGSTGEFPQTLFVFSFWTSPGEEYTAFFIDKNGSYTHTNVVDSAFQLLKSFP